MPTLAYAVLADFVRAEGGLAHLIAAGIDTVGARQVPTGQNLGLLAGVRFTRAECGRPHRFEVLFSDEDGAVLTRGTGIIVPEWDKDLPVHWGRAMQAAVNLGVPLPRYGLYQFSIMVDDQELGTLHLRVIPYPDGEPEVEAPAEPE